MSCIDLAQPPLSMSSQTFALHDLCDIFAEDLEFCGKSHTAMHFFVEAIIGVKTG